MSIFLGDSLRLKHALAVWKAGTWGMERALMARTNFNIANQPKEKDNATILVHGISGHTYGWSSNFKGNLKSRASNQDYYEFTWSGYI